LGVKAFDESVSSICRRAKARGCYGTRESSGFGRREEPGGVGRQKEGKKMVVSVKKATLAGQYLEKTWGEERQVAPAMNSAAAATVKQGVAGNRVTQAGSILKE